jgi:hypothetical protein
MRAAMFASQWAIAVADVGDLAAAGGGRGGLTAAVRAYSQWWDESERQVYRHLKVWREVFPEQESPAEIAAELAPHYVDLVAHLREVTDELAAVRRAKLTGQAAAGLSLPLGRLAV